MSSPPTKIESECTACAKRASTATLKLCGTCLLVRYCSLDCQKKDWKNHKTVCQHYSTPPVVHGDGPAQQPLYSVEAMPGKGQGVIASADIPRGTRIISETSIFDLDRNVYDIEAAEDQVQTAVRSLSSQQREAFFALHNAHGDDHSSAFGIARTNALPLGSHGDKGGVFLDASRINHSCTPNAQNTWNADLSQITIHAARDIPKGEEICICYIDGFHDYAARRETLDKYFNFRCTCTVCSLPETLRRESDERRNKMSMLHDSIGDGMSIISTPLACLRDAHELFTLLGEEHLTTAFVPQLYYDAFQIVIANGDEARARTFARLAYDERVVLEGRDSPDARRLKALVDEPRNHSLYETSMRWKQSVSKIPQDPSPEELEKWLWRKS